jgi:hypothetical protein
MRTPIRIVERNSRWRIQYRRWFIWREFEYITHVGKKVAEYGALPDAQAAAEKVRWHFRDKRKKDKWEEIVRIYG